MLLRRSLTVLCPLVLILALPLYPAAFAPPAATAAAQQAAAASIPGAATPPADPPAAAAPAADAPPEQARAAVPAAGTTQPAAAAAAYAFELPVFGGGSVAVQPNSQHAVTVICFLGSECPLVRLYSSRLSAMASELAPRGVRFVGINSNRQDTAEDIQLYLQEHALSFPLARDSGNVVADQFGAERTPEVFVLDQQLQLRYRGRIDDQYAPGVTRPAVSRADLRLAIEQVLAGEPVSVPQTDAVGCLIGKVRRTPIAPAAAAANITYCQQISRVLQRHCLECHRAGEIGPFAMESYEDVVGWADTMLEVIDNGRMPPWHADPAYGHFTNARQMPAADRQLLQDWVAAGMPQGDPADLPEPVKFPDGWQLPREPDAVLSMQRPYAIPAEGTVEYQYFVVDPGWQEDRWVTAAQVIPGNRSVVHHAIVFIRPPDGTPLRGIGWLTAYVPGQRTVAMPSGHARRVPAGSKLVFQMHYTTNGSPQEDRSQVGVLFGQPADITHEVITLIGIDQEFEIPPHAAAHAVNGEVRRFPRDGRLLAVAPHMHLRGKGFELFAERGDQSETLLRVPNYDFNWQHSYEFAKPLELADIDRLKFTVTFDNSAGNPFNPDPTQWVNWGDQTWEEMAVAFFEVAEPRHTGSSPAAQHSGDTAADNKTASAQTREQQIARFVDDFFQQLDTNGDGIVLQSEVPLAVRSHFRRFDRNQDNQASRSEVRQVAEERFPE